MVRYISLTHPTRSAIALSLQYQAIALKHFGAIARTFSHSTIVAIANASYNIKRSHL
ncbi:MAG: hypothetical protein RM049_36390 [Nostoc sp. DedQUE04]|uniref:hypothetical protein n=1 Tax=Nostoc sp. DedQUE04 TaxID=3075390 RepID=UPI002AD52C04|nr:hypothetical protein [Nostoc sp. DedQUE04]MDZ8140715.1 hypothetical protein [Nostoc sp. DedQUE04]